METRDGFIIIGYYAFGSYEAVWLRKDKEAYIAFHDEVGFRIEPLD